MEDEANSKNEKKKNLIQLIIDAFIKFIYCLKCKKDENKNGLNIEDKENQNDLNYKILKNIYDNYCILWRHMTVNFPQFFHLLNY